MAAVSLYRMAERPYLMSGLGILVGYLKARREGARQLEDREYRELLRRFERDTLLFGKSRTARKYHDRIRRETPRRRVEAARPVESSPSESVAE
jgi:hypothetical protein